MKYLVRKSFVEVLGTLWLPFTPAATRYPLTEHDIENIRAYGGGISDRDAVELWLSAHSGDFADVADFAASVEDGEDTIDIPWADEASGLAFGDAMNPEGG